VPLLVRVTSPWKPPGQLPAMEYAAVQPPLGGAVVGLVVGGVVGLVVGGVVVEVP